MTDSNVVTLQSNTRTFSLTQGDTFSIHHILSGFGYIYISVSGPGGGLADPGPWSSSMTGTLNLDILTTGNYTFTFELYADNNSSVQAMLEFSCSGDTGGGGGNGGGGGSSLTGNFGTSTNALGNSFTPGFLNNSPSDLPNDNGGQTPQGGGPDDFNDGNHLLGYAALPYSPINRAVMAINAADDGVEGNMVAPGHLFDAWSRFKLTFVDGTLGRTGAMSHAQFGVVKSMTPEIDLGGFLSVFGGDVAMTSLNANLSAFGGGAGAYVKYFPMPDVRAGLSGSFDVLSNDMWKGNENGQFMSYRTTINASLEGSYNFGEIRFTPIGTLRLLHEARDAFTTNRGRKVGATTVDQVIASTWATIDRTFEVESQSIATVTPSIGGGVNFNLVGPGPITFGGGLGTLTTPVATGGVSAGVTLQFNNGASLDLSTGINGIGDTLQTYNAAAKLTAPIN
ncbi:MAG: autotransporter outer membrane beta-barrel domain-containing protein [Hyphomicrobiaceae bacterium]|nr:autotransporter outer membrane beta-barrel domain-containing protein [Hyphomicrobiaceae bacterium]